MTTGTPVAGATVSVTGASSDSAAATSETRAAETRADGSFEFQGLRSGSFRICAAAPESLVLNPCDWGDLTKITLASDAVTSYTMRLNRGVAVSVRIYDSDDLIPSEGLAYEINPFLPVLVSRSGRFLPMVATSSAAHWHEYRRVIPPRTDMLLRLYTRAIGLSSRANESIDVRSPIPLNGGPGDRISVEFGATRTTRLDGDDR